MNSDPKLLQDLQEYLHAQIPLTKAMGVRLASRTPESLIVAAPLEPNHNHLGTAFGGSLAALATLAGYCLLWLELGDRSAHVVVRESAISYLRPVVEPEIRAVCLHPGPDAASAFLRDFTRRGKARLRLQVTIASQGEIAVDFTAAYVALSS